MLKGLLFDLDGVLTNSAKFHLTAWNNLAKELDITLTDEQLNSLRGISRMDSLELILKYGGQEDKYSKAEKEKFAAEKNAKFGEQVETMTPNDILPGIPELLADAKKQNLKMVIASASKNAPKILSRLGIMNEFNGIVDPATLHYGKPAPEIYEKAQTIVGLKDDEVISFEDAAAGVESIKAAGQFAVGIGNEKLLKSKGADYVVPSTADLKLGKIEKVFEEKD